MRHHVVLKLRSPLSEPPRIPDWITFIQDKSTVVSSVDAEVDRVLAPAGGFWVTHEYRPAGSTWQPLETLHGLDRTYRLVLATDRALPEEVIVRLQALRHVEAAWQLTVGTADIPVASTQSLTPPPRDDLIGKQFAHAVTRGRPDITVAVLDTGVDRGHPELDGVVTGSADFVDLAGLDTAAFVGDVLGRDDDATDELGHGTHVAGIVAGRGRDMEVGIAPDCRLLAVRVLATMRVGQHVQGAGIVDNINPAFKWAVDHGADVINLSLGIRHEGGGLPHEDVVRYALGRGATVVAASGNDGTDTKYYPGALPGVIAVGAADPTGRPASFTSYGARITVSAPGVDIRSSHLRHGYAVASGTSQAAPVVSGAVALLKSYAADRGVRLAEDDVRRVLRETSDRTDSRPRTATSGYGLINLPDALKWLMHSFN